MIQALIVDDEPLQIDGLVRHVHWDSLGYAKPITADSGEEALEILAREPVDVLITDVTMPGMSGIELLSACKLEQPHLQSLQTLIISGYDDFEFVQEAIHLGAKGYVLKPIKTDELEEKLKTIRDSILKRNQIERETSELKEKLSGSFDVLQERFVNDLLEGRAYNEELLASWCRLLDLPREEKEWRISLFLFGYDRLLPSDGHDARQRILLGDGLMKTVKVSLSEYAGVYSGKTGADEAAILLLNPPPSERAKMEKQFPFIQDIIKEKYGSTVTVGVSRECRSWEEAPLLYKEVKHMMAKARLAGEEQILYFDRVEETEYQDHRLRDEYIPEIVKLMEKGDSGQAEAYFNYAFDALLTQETVAFSYVQAFGMGLVSELARKIRRYRTAVGEMNVDMWQRVIACTNAEEVRGVVLEYFSKYTQLEQGEQAVQQHHLIHNIAQFIEEHIQDNVTVKQLAEQFHFNASYLSVLFKKEMGITISDYVQEIRISKAKELLRDPNVKVYEVAEQVGFQTAAYFTFLFKKVTGSTPQEFRDYRYEE
ncbi:response regulator [Gorillibacterium timonense]|uniref:response regulator n=1 Tax=Gorillibacterium timonense TaxID=1689269 RepID=UPI000A79646F|nr:response regulator [Gorillibacterium timonense]